MRNDFFGPREIGQDASRLIRGRKPEFVGIVIQPVGEGIDSVVEPVAAQVARGENRSRQALATNAQFPVSLMSQLYSVPVSGDCTSVRKRVSRSCGSTVRAVACAVARRALKVRSSIYLVVLSADGPWNLRKGDG